MRLLLVQYAGDYLSAHEFLQSSGTEAYFGHRYVLEQIGELSTRVEDIAILCCLSPTAHDQRLPSGVRVIGTGIGKNWSNSETWRVIRDFAPTHLVVLGPLTGAIRWGLKTNCKLLCILADSFEINPVRRFLRYGRLPSLLNNPRVTWVGNHGVNSCRSLQNYGVNPDKIVPWDWLHARQPQDSSVRSSAGPGPWSLFFAGQVTERKGIRDVISAIALLKARGLQVTARIAGQGEIDRYGCIAEEQGVRDRIDFLGLIPNHMVLEHMRAASLVVVPSQHAYPEGLPLTIYEALCARTPIVASDHPMFFRRLVHEENALIYRAGRVSELADRIEQLLRDRALYERISEASQRAWEKLQIPIKWGDLVRCWLTADENGWQLLHDHRLSSGLYSQ